MKRFVVCAVLATSSFVHGVNRTQCVDEGLAQPGHPVGYGLNGLGVMLGCVGSISINIGNNLQAKGLKEKNGLWAVGCTIFFVASIIQFVAFAFAPAAVIAPLESLQFVANLAFAKFVNRQKLTNRMLAGTVLILIGVIVAVVFGPIDGTQIIPLETLNDYWTAPGWLVYFGLIIGVAFAAELLHRRYTAAAARGESLWAQSDMLPITYAVGSSLLGTQAVVQAKCAAEAVKLMGVGCAVEVLSNWYIYVTVLLLASMGILWVVRLNRALELYDPLFIIPLLQSMYILCATISGGIYFQEFTKLTAAKVALFTIGIATMLCGLVILIPPKGASREAMSSEARAEMTDGKRANALATSDRETRCNLAVSAPPEFSPSRGLAEVNGGGSAGRRLGMHENGGAAAAPCARRVSRDAATVETLALQGASSI